MCVIYLCWHCIYVKLRYTLSHTVMLYTDEVYVAIHMHVVRANVESAARAAKLMPPPDEQGLCGQRGNGPCSVVPKKKKNWCHFYLGEGYTQYQVWIPNGCKIFSFNFSC